MRRWLNQCFTSARDLASIHFSAAISRQRRWVWQSSLVVASLLAFSVGGSSAASTGNKMRGVQEAMAAVKQASLPPRFEVPGPAFKVASGLSGKLIWYVANGLNFPFSENLVAGVKNAAKVEGMTVKAVDGAGEPAKAAGLIQEGISQHAAVIILQAEPTASVAQAIKAAKAAHIPVVEISDGEPGLPPASARADGVFANVAASYATAGSLLADAVVANTKGHADVAFIEVPDIVTTLAELSAFKRRLTQLCSSCQLHVASSPIAQWGSLAQLTASLLHSNPSLNFLVPAVDAMAPLMEPAVNAADAQTRLQLASDTVTIATLNLNPPRGWVEGLRSPGWAG